MSDSFEYDPNDFQSDSDDFGAGGGSDFEFDDFDGGSDFDFDDGSFDMDGSLDQSMSDIDDPEIKIENMFLEAKDSVEDAGDKKACIADFEKIVTFEKDEFDEQGKWGFKALKWIVKINHNIGEQEKSYEAFMRIINNYSHLLVEHERAINKLFDHISSSSHIKEMYQKTLEKLESIGNKKASLRLEIKLAKVLLKKKDYGEMDTLLEAMHNRCKVDGQDDSSKGNQLIEIYAMKIERHLRSENPDFKELKYLYNKARVIKGLSNPRNTGILHECGGKVFLRERDYTSANTDFIEAFKGFDSAGSRSLAVNCLKYLILSNMLSNSEINPFDEARAKSYQSTPEISSMIAIIESYTSRDVQTFDKVLKQNEKDIESDPFIADYISDLKKKLRSHVLKALIRPYRNITLGYITSELRITPEETESLLVELILDKEISGRLDQVNQTLLLDRSNASSYTSLGLWVKNLDSLTRSIAGKVH
eukprot:TRINITY_DN9098_c0_g1_i1.p1 TRINITY_DN9098_c0_g1~~TRINITY_DN9098_c0_g1_i1.p1  ORF type:complete len:477 (+),score=128.68 TRINITY_DN9098_c0_g1_i1:23-1453(+)